MNDYTPSDKIDRERIAKGGHEEARQRLAALGRSKPTINQLEDATNFYEFARVVASAVKYSHKDSEQKYD
jgi:hypothetical protein